MNGGVAKLGVVGRSGLARILGCSESTTRNLEARGLLAPEQVVEGRPLFSVEKAKRLRLQRDSGRPQAA